jgi:tetratricopeptide (TPR) repeat protein
LKRLVLLLAGLVTVGSRATGLSPERLERQGYSGLERGDLSGAERSAAAGLEWSARHGSTAWSWAFRVLHAEVLRHRGEGPSALALLSAEAPALPLETQVRLEMTRGYLRCLQSEGAARRAALEELAEAQRQAVAASAALRGQVAQRLGTCAFENDEVEVAEEQFSQALALARQAGLPALEAGAVANLGRIQMQRHRYDDAAESFARAQTIAESLGLQIATNVAINRSWCHLLLGEFEKARTVAEETARVAHARGYGEVEMVALQNLGNAHYQLGELPEAVAAYAQAAEAARRQKDRKVLAQILGNLAIVALDGQHLEEARTYNAEAQRLKEELQDRPGLAHATQTAARIAEAMGDLGRSEALLHELLRSPALEPALAWEAHASLGSLYGRQGRAREAEGHFKQAIEAVERARSGLRGEERQISFFASLRSLYDDYTQFLVRASRDPEALEISERSRARILLERSGVESGRPASFSELLALSRSRSLTLLSFWVTRDRSVAWVIGGGRLSRHELPPGPELAAKAEAYQRLIENSGDPLGEGLPAARDLSAAVLEPLLARIPAGARVVVAADGPLQRLNLETLLVDGPERHYWIEDVEVGYAPSLSLLSRSACPSPGHRPERLLALGNPVSADPQFPPLPNAGRELEEIGRLFAPEDRAVFTGPAADPVRYREAAPERYSLIHFAAHARAERENPLDSAILLSPRGHASKLYARDVMAVPIRARVVTLSACRSALARVYAGEGPVGLAWAFLRAGAENVIAGLWDVEDASAKELMTALYGQLRAGADPGDALRAAKLRLLRSGTSYRKPNYWAPFVTYTRCPARNSGASSKPDRLGTQIVPASRE